MANYDTPGLLYGQAFYDEPAPPPKKPKRMAKIKLSLHLLSVAQKVALGRLVVTQMTGNANFTTPSPTLASITTLADDLEDLAADQDTKQQAAKTATALMNTKEDQLNAALTALGSWAEGHVVGDGDKLLSGGFSLQGQATPTVLVQVTGLEASPGDDGGEVDTMWNPVDGATGYEMQTSSNPNDPALWMHKDIFSKSKATLTGLPTGARCWFRVRAVGPNNQKGPWSNPADKVVP